MPKHDITRRSRPARTEPGEFHHGPPAPRGGASILSQRGMHRLVGGGAEALLALGLTLAFFSAFLALLNLIFPTGIGLRELMSPPVESQPAVSAPEAAAAAPESGAPGPWAPGEIARLTVLRRDVKSKAAEAIAWTTAASGLALGDRDAVQTMSAGRALVSFAQGDYLRIERNSLVVVTADRDQIAEADQRPAVVVSEGELWGRFELGAGQRMRVALPSGTLDVAAAAEAGPAEFHVAVKPDRSSRISLYHGRARLEAGGNTVSLRANQASGVSPQGVVSAPVELPPTPMPGDPADGAEFSYGDLPPQIRFRWSAAPGADAYRLIVTRDRELKDVVIDETVLAAELMCGRLKAGEYFWRVSSMRQDAESVPSRLVPIRVVRVGEPPKLAVEDVPKIVETNHVVIRGRVTPGSRVLISGEKVRIGIDGRFEYDAALRPGVNMVTIEAMDAVGNASYWTRVITAKF